MVTVAGVVDALVEQAQTVEQLDRGISAQRFRPQKRHLLGGVFPAVVFGDLGNNYGGLDFYVI